MKKIFTISLLIISLLASGQSETHDFIHYDTTFSAGGQLWIARISRPANMFTVNHPDTASRGALITMPGLGEVGTNYADLQKYGPHYWLNNGWDGSIVTGSGTHYPILITLISSVANPRVNRSINALQHLLNTYHIKRNSVHLAGLSMGAFTWASVINGQLTSGGEEGMSMVTSLVLLQGDGQGATSGLMGSAIPFDATGYRAFGHWAAKYGGTFLGLEGTADTRNVWQPRDNIEDSVPGAGYFAYENIGGGAHCCWNSMYDPSRRNWKNQLGDLGTNIAWNTNHNNSMGTYVNGWNIFEWMFRQGDTSLVGTGNAPPAVNAGADKLIYLPTDSVDIDATTSDSDGTIVSYSWAQISGPAAATIVSPSAEDTRIKDMVTAGIYTFRLTVTDNGSASGSDDINVVVNADTTIYPSPAGKKMAGPGEYQTYFIDNDGYLWAIGNIGNLGINNSGTYGRAYQPLVTAGMKFTTVAGGLHGGAAVDTTGHVWVMGDNDQYQHGIGNNTHPIYTPSQILTDSAGNDFDNVKSVAAFFVKSGANGYNGFYAIKNDGTLWGWGYMIFGMRGDGTSGAIKSRPVQIDVDGKQVAHVVAGQFVQVICVDGSVYTWGEGVSSANLGYTGTTEEKRAPHQIFSGGIRQIAGGMLWNYAIDSSNVLYGWGSYGNYMGNANGLPISTPTVLNNIMNGLPLPIDKIVTNSACTHVILTDSSLWGWGNNGQGTIGNGERLNFHLNGGNPFDRDNLIQLLPYHVAPGIKFDTIFGGSTYTYHSYARDKNDSLYCWGRGKGNVLANWLQAASSGITATYGNTWDIAYPTPVDPFNITTTYIQTSDYCVKVDATQSPCNQYVIPANTAPVANAGADQNLSNVTSATLDGSGSTDNVYISRYEWRQLTGGACTIQLPAAKTTLVTGMSDGNYSFELLTEDNGFLIARDTVTISINQAANQLPVITSLTSTADTIQLPVSTVKITVTGTDADGTIDEYALTLKSGPGGAGPSFLTPTLDTCTVYNFTIPGTYIFEYRITDNDGGETAADIPIVVLPASSAGAIKKYKVNISNGTTNVLTGNWNNWPATTDNATLLNIYDTAGVQSNISLSLSKSSVPAANSIPTSLLADFPDSVFQFVSFGQSRELLITGLENDVLYTTQFLPYRAVNNNTCATINSIKKCVNSLSNTDSVIEHSDIVPINGTIAVGISPEPSTQTYIAAFIIKRQGTSTPVNIPPVAEAGDNAIIVLPKNFITLNGSASTDADDGIISYHWRLVNSEYPVSFSNADSVICELTGLPEGRHTVELTVTDASGATSTDNIEILVLGRKFLRGIKGIKNIWKSAN